LYYFFGKIELYVELLKGLVRSPISATLPQVCGRILVTWYIVWSFPEVASALDLSYYTSSGFKRAC